MGALRAARDAGSVRFVGASVYTAAEGRAAIEIGRADVLMITHNLLNHAESDELLAVADAHGCAVLARSVLANGLLTGKYDARTTFAGRRPPVASRCRRGSPRRWPGSTASCRSPSGTAWRSATWRWPTRCPTRGSPAWWSAPARPRSSRDNLAAAASRPAGRRRS